MTAYAGFYAAPEVWKKWVRSHPKCPVWKFGATFAEDLIEDALRKVKMADYFFVEVVPVPPSELDYRDGARGLMLVRQMGHREAYISQRPDSRYDLAGQQILKQLIGLEVSEWTTMWYNELSYDPPYEAKFLKPGPGKSKTAKGSKVKAKARTKANNETSATKSEAEEGEDRYHDSVETSGDGDVKVEECEVEDGWVTLRLLSVHST